MNQRKQISADEQIRILNTFAIFKQHMNELVINYFDNYRLQRSTEGFQLETRIDLGADLSSLEDHKQLRRFIMEVSIGEAMDL